MKKSLVIILIALLSNVVFATDNVEQMATTLGNSEQPTVGTNLLLNIKPKGATSSTSWEEPTSSNGGGSISIIGGQVKKGGTGSSGGGATGGISSFSSGRRSSVSNVGASSPSSVSGGGPRKALGGGGSGTEEPEPGDRPDPYKDPIGTIPFALMLMLAVGYGIYKKLIFDN